MFVPLIFSILVEWLLPVVEWNILKNLFNTKVKCVTCKLVNYIFCWNNCLQMFWLDFETLSIILSNSTSSAFIAKPIDILYDQVKQIKLVLIIEMTIIPSWLIFYFSGYHTNSNAWLTWIQYNTVWQCIFCWKYFYILSVKLWAWKLFYFYFTDMYIKYNICLIAFLAVI